MKTTFQAAGDRVHIFLDGFHVGDYQDGDMVSEFRLLGNARGSYSFSSPVPRDQAKELISRCVIGILEPAGAFR